MKKEPWYSHQLTQDELKVFVEEARIGKSNSNVFVGTVTPAAAKRIEAVCNKKVEKIMLESGAVRHAYKKVNHNLKDDDLLQIVEIINTATDIQVSNIKHQNNECLEISYNLDGKIILILEVRIHYGGWLSLVTCYRTKK
jgi:hypothetical protein